MHPRGEASFSGFSCFLFLRIVHVFKSISFAVGLDDVDAVGDAVEQCPGEPFIEKDFGPLFEGQVGGHDDALAFVGAAKDIEEQFSPSFAEDGVIAGFIEDE